MQRAHAACKPHKLAALWRPLSGIPSVLQAASSGFVHSSKIPSMSCVASRCVALNGCYFKGQQSCALDEARDARATIEMIL